MSGGRHWLSFLRSKPVKRWQSSSSLLPPPVSRFEALSDNSRSLAFAMAGFLGGAAFIYSIINPNKIQMSRLKSMMGLEPSSHSLEKRKLSNREKRFIKFSSVEFRGQIYMTPQDFLESVIEAEPKPRLKRRNLTEKELSQLQSNTPDIKSNSDVLFRSLANKGIISYTEYLFLLTILIKPFSGFKIAFSMLDQDGNERIDKKEFKVLESIFTAAAQERREDGVDDDHGLIKHHQVDTSILLHLFGRDGSGELKYTQFCTFMNNLQTEVLNMEFGEFSKGAPTISELDFARILLRYTFLNSEDYDNILERLVLRLDEEKGITFEEFRDFCLFLNNLDDFQIAMRMYTMAEKPISQVSQTEIILKSILKLSYFRMNFLVQFKSAQARP